MSEANVVYEATRPRYTVERSLGMYSVYTRETLWGRWEADRAFHDPTEAGFYADEQQLIFPDAKFRVVDNEA